MGITEGKLKCMVPNLAVRTMTTIVLLVEASYKRYFVV